MEAFVGVAEVAVLGGLEQSVTVGQRSLLRQTIVAAGKQTKAASMSKHRFQLGMVYLTKAGGAIDVLRSRGRTGPSNSRRTAPSRAC